LRNFQFFETLILINGREKHLLLTFDITAIYQFSN